jgi:hypothetical protein
LHSSPCTRPHRVLRYATLHSTNTWLWPTRSVTGVRANGSTPNRNFTAVSRRQMRDPNLEQLIAAANALRPLLPELVFVGGCVTGLLITDEAAGEPRGTIDVDAVAEITSYAQYAAFGDRPRSLGFIEDAREGAPVCRWIQGEMILDVMPLDEKILGFSNRGYKAAICLPLRCLVGRDGILQAIANRRP